MSDELQRLAQLALQSGKAVLSCLKAVDEKHQGDTDVLPFV